MSSQCPEQLVLNQTNGWDLGLIIPYATDAVMEVERSVRILQSPRTMS
jgi:hypothetical protein